MAKLQDRPAADAEGAAAPTAPPAPRAKRSTGRVSLLDTARPLSEINDFANVLFSGENGTAKTTAVAAMANLGPIIVINAEGGLRKGALRRRGINVENIRVLPEKPEDLTFEFLDRLYVDLRLALDEDPNAIVGVCWDSITEITAKMLENVVEKAQEKAEAENKDRDPFFTDIADYGVMAKQVRQLIRRYRDLPCHFAATSLLKRDVDDDGSVVYRPQVIPSLRTDLMGYMDLVIVTDVGEFDGQEEYRGLTKPVGKFRGKDRFGVLPRRLLDPTFDRVWSYITEDLDVDSDPVMLDAKRRRLEAKGETIDELVDGEGEEIDDTGAEKDPTTTD